MRAEITTDMLMFMSTITLRVAPAAKHILLSRLFEHFLLYLMILFKNHIPRADKMAADQKISPMSAGMKRSPPILLP